MDASPEWGPLPPRYGLFRLADHFEQRPIGMKHGSIRSRIPLLTPSGAQDVESELEAELLEQLHFAPAVYDLLTQPIIRYRVDGKERRYTPDIAAYLLNLGCDAPLRYLIEVKRAEDLRRNGEKYREHFEVARLYADKIGAQFRIATEAEIRTPYLANTRALRCQVGKDITDEELNILCEILDAGPRELRDTIQGLVEAGSTEAVARDIVERAIVKRLAACDLSQAITEHTMLSRPKDTLVLRHDNDPLLRSLQHAHDR